MANAHLIPRLTIAGVPMHAMLVPFPIACFTGALLTDIAYLNTAEIQWANFSAWLLAFGVLTGGIAAVGGMIDLFAQKSLKPLIAWVHMGGNIGLLIIALINNFVHARDGWTSVVPTGIILSAVTVAIMMVTGFLGHKLAYSHVRRS